MNRAIWLVLDSLGLGAAPGRRDSFADIGQGLATHLGLPPLAAGRCFLTTA